MIHQYKMKDLNLVLDINSGAVHAVDELVYKIIEMLEEGESLIDISHQLEVAYKDYELDDAIDEVSKLIQSGQLFSADTYGEIIKGFEERETIVKALCLHIAHDCNLGCKYCFAGDGSYTGERSLMSLEVGKKAIDFLIANSGNRRNLEVDFFGGEPLMNFEVVKDIVTYARGFEKEHHKNFRFTITTNGVLLDDDKIKYIDDNMHNVVMSLDGRKEVHDKIRPFRNGKGSYDLIVPKFKKMVEARGDKSYYLRGTYTHYNTDFSQDVMHMADLGFKEISVEPVVAPEDMPYALQESDIPILCEQYDILVDDMLKRREAGNAFNFFHFNIDLNQGPCVIKRMTGCGCGSEYMAVTPQGDLYPCHQFVGMDDFKMGDVYTGVEKVEMQETFKGCHVYSKPKCQDCWAKFYCSGGCTANAYNFHNDILDVYELGCELQKKRVECAIYLKAKELLAD